MDQIDSAEDQSFDFINDQKFRTSLQSDYREILRCIETSAWKAVHVLAGSVVEAILVDYLIASGYQKQTGNDPMKMELGAVISASKDEKVISQRTANLSSVVQSYRNLIHPARVIRLNETVDRKTALVAKNLVDIIADEVAATKAEKYGLTAEQIANKVEKDSSAIAVLSHFLSEANEVERERLLTDVLPDRYFSTLDEEFEAPMSAADYRKCFRQTFDTLSNERRTTVAKRYIKVLKEESKDRVFAYETTFFEAGYLKYLPANEAALAKEHVLSRLEKEQSVDLLIAVDGLGKFLKKDEVFRVIDAYVKVLVYGKTEPQKRKAGEVLEQMYYEVPKELEEVGVQRMDEWIKLFEEKNREQPKAALEGIKATWMAPF